MIGKPTWFARRKYSGWGFVPRTWQGWVYIAALILPIVAFQSIPYWSTTTRIAVTAVWFVLFGIDAIDIMIHLKKDEREVMHEAIAERNVAWFMVIVLAAGIAYQSARSAASGSVSIDPWMVIALVGGLLVKIATNLYMEHKA